MRFIKRVIFGTITGLLVFYIIKSIKRHNSQKQESEEYLASEGASDFGNAVGAVASHIATDDTLAQSVENKSDSPEAEKESDSPDSVFIQEGTKALVLSSIPHTPSLFQETDAPEQSAGRILEAEDDFTVNAQDTGGSENSPIVRLFDSPSEIEPLQHPGRRARTGKHYPPVTTPMPKAKLRCRENADGWSLYLEMPEEREVTEIHHNGKPLSRNKIVEIHRFAGQVVVNYGDGESDTVDLSGSSPLYFGTDDEWERDGIFVRDPSSGYFVVIAPVDMDDEFAESEHEPDDCVDSLFHAHFLAIGAKDDTERHGKYPMTLTGNVLYDAASVDFQGELYVRQPPELSVSRMVSWARIVEDTGSLYDDSWGENFKPHSQTIESVLNGREGRFSIRTYLKGSRRQHESKPFRYFSRFDHITLNGEDYTSDLILEPDEDGQYGETTLSFSGKDGFVKPATIDNPEVSLSEDGLATIPPNPSVTNITCEFPNRVSVVISIPRIWWRIKTDETAGEWNNLPDMNRKQFIASARRGDFIEVLLPRSIEAIDVGFGNSTDHRVPKVKDTATIHLRDLADHVLVDNILPGKNDTSKRPHRRTRIEPDGYQRTRSKKNSAKAMESLEPKFSNDNL